MANEFYQPGEQRQTRVKELFGRIATRYDLMNDLQSFGLHRYWKRKVIRLAHPAANVKALDVCCGTGDLALMLAGRGARVIGVDFSEQMLQIAERRKKSFRPCPVAGNVCNSPNGVCSAPEFIQADALQLPFADGSFEIVTMAYGLRNLPEAKAGLREMSRVAAPGGRLLVLDFGKPENAVWRCLYFGYLKFFVPLLGCIFCGSASAYAYILESLKHYPAQRGVAAQMQELGLVNVQIINLLGGVMSINYGETSS
jgi:demethylmenaquinone methyltransferase/2-methoxy-6-polyprenyl-1,4-benzoquinol methylase